VNDTPEYVTAAPPLVQNPIANSFAADNVGVVPLLNDADDTSVNAYWSISDDGVPPLISHKRATATRAVDVVMFTVPLTIAAGDAFVVCHTSTKSPVNGALPELLDVFRAHVLPAESVTPFTVIRLPSDTARIATTMTSPLPAVVVIAGDTKGLFCADVSVIATDCTIDGAVPPPPPPPPPPDVPAWIEAQ
jgi:hypothetical protein